MARYIVTDLHGRYDLYQEIEKFRAENDRIICLGDCGDRGPKSFETIQAVANNPDWTYLMGNHEHMTMEALMERVSKTRSHWYEPTAYQTSCQNGGGDTFDAMKDDAEKWIKFFKSLPYRLDVKNEMGYDVILTHAGFDITEEVAKDNFDYIWDRYHIHLPWPTDRKYENIVMIHGHTPIQVINPKWTIDDGSFSYADGHKIDLDIGSYVTGAAIVFDLDTFDEHIFLGD